MEESTREQRGPSGRVPIYTIGYGSREMEQMIRRLKAIPVDYLLDVRSAPYSKFRPEFSKDALEKILGHHSIRYLFVGDSLGGRPEDPECYVNGKVDYDKIREKPFYQEAIQRLLKASEQGQRVVLMCSEGKPETCHRSKLIGESLAAMNIPVVHIDENDEPKNQTEVIDRLTRGQLDLFGQSSFGSKKRYDRGDHGEK